MRSLILIVLMLLLSACGPTFKIRLASGEIEVKGDDLPRQVAVLPFDNGTGEPGIESLVRRNFANHFSSKAYLDLKLPVVDEKLLLFQRSSGKTVQQATPQELSAALGADGLLYGKVTGYNRIYAGVYSQLGVEAEVWLVNARSGKELFRFKEEVRYHEGGVPISPLSAAVTVVSTAMNLREIQKVRLVNELCYKFMEKIPSPKGLAADARPIVKEVLTNAANGPFTAKRVVKVGLEGEPGLVASFDIGSFRKAVPMKEVEPGIYGGEYAVVPGDNTRDMPVTVTLSRPGGYETKWVDVSGFVTIDTVAPPLASGVRAKGFPDRIEVSWEGVKNVPDLKGYRVLRSDSPLSGYRELAEVEIPAFTDRSAALDRSYYYRVVPVDAAGNEADAGDAVRAALAAAEPRQVAGELKEDTVWEGAYLVTAPVSVPQGVSLTISEHSSILFAPEAGLKVRGRLTVRGGDAPVEFGPAGEGSWSGIDLDAAQASLTRFRIKGAGTGIASSESETSVDGGVITGCDTAISVSGMPHVEVKGTTISGNETGMSLTGTSALVTGCDFTQNRIAVEADRFSGAIRDNNFIDNEGNIDSETALEVAANWFGAVEADRMKLGNVSATRVYDGRIPGGAVIAAVADPYRDLTPEERQRRGVELLIEAGGYFRQRNYGKAMAVFAETLKVSPCPESYYYLSLCHQEMKEQDKALVILRQGVDKYKNDPMLWKSLGILLYERGEEDGARQALQETLRLSPDDRQARFVMERMTDKK